MDEHVPRAVTDGLRRRGVAVLTAQEAGMVSAADDQHLEFAAKGGYVVFTQDADFLRLHAAGASHTGIVYVRQQTPIGYMLRGLILIYNVLSPQDIVGRVQFL
jgi:predicted nuclease of predicted toxin-antitoxin system